MKTTNLVIALAVSGTLTLGVASPTNSIDAQIEAIKKAEPNKRVQLMNQFKQQLMQMNAQERENALSKMRNEMQEHQENMQNHTEMQNHNEMEMEHKNTSFMQEHATEMESHMQDEHDMIQGNHQNQFGNEVAHEMGGKVEPHEGMQNMNGGEREFKMENH